MASAINGTNIVLYEYDSNAIYYFNGGVSEGTIGGTPYYQMSRTQVSGDSTNFTRSADGEIACFVTDIGDPNQVTVPSGTWVFKNYMSITSNVTGGPNFAIVLYKYNGSSLTFIASSDSNTFTSTSTTLYTTNITVPTTTLASTDRILVKFIILGAGSRTVTLYTQGTNSAYVTSTFPLGTPMGASTSCSFEATTEQVEVTSSSSAWFRQFKNDIMSWTVSCDGLIALTGYSYLALMQKQLNRESVPIKFSINNDNADGSGLYGYSVISGTTNITSLSLNAPVEGVSTYSLSLQGTGAYAISGTQVINGGTSVSTSGVSSAPFIASGGEYTITFVGGIGKALISLTRGGIEVRTINTSGVPTGEDVTFNSLTGVLTFARALEADEFIRATFS